jgi:hypothetical protein
MHYERPSLARVALMGLMTDHSCPPGTVPKRGDCLKETGAGD